LIQRIQEEGRTSIDVGCMQINLQFHGHAFRSVREVLDPASNVAYAASFLQKLMSETGSWRSAAGYYHSRDPKRAARYLEKLGRMWQDAKPSRPGLPAAAERRAFHLAENHQIGGCSRRPRLQDGGDVLAIERQVLRKRTASGTFIDLLPTSLVSPERRWLDSRRGHGRGLGRARRARRAARLHGRSRRDSTPLPPGACDIAILKIGH
jgi:hypothetical protein